MNPEHFGLVEMAFGFGIVLAWAVWELWSVRRSQRQDAERRSAEGSRHPEGQQGPHEG